MVLPLNPRGNQIPSVLQHGDPYGPILCNQLLQEEREKKNHNSFFTAHRWNTWLLFTVHQMPCQSTPLKWCKSMWFSYFPRIDRWGKWCLLFHQSYHVNIRFNDWVSLMCTEKFVKLKLRDSFTNGHEQEKSSLVTQMVKNLFGIQDTWIQSLGWEGPLEKGMAIHSSNFAVDRGVWQARVHRVAKIQTLLSDYIFFSMNKRVVPSEPWTLF